MFNKLGLIAIMLSAFLLFTAGCSGGPGETEIRYDGKDKSVGGSGTPDEEDGMKPEMMDQ